MIRFIEHEDLRVWELGYGGVGVGGVEDNEEEVGGVDLSGGDGDGVLFDWIVGGAEARGIEEDDDQAIEVGHFADPIAGGARLVGGDGTSLGEELIGEGGFTDVG